MSGSVSGGCVENDVVAHAREVLAAGRARLVTYGIADELGLAVGLSCGGSIEVLIEPFDADPSWRALRAAVETRHPAALAIALEPADLLGRRMVAVEGERPVGTVGAALDAGLADAVRSAAGDENGTATREVALPCGADTATFFVETVPPQARLVVIGATHVAIPLTRLATALGLEVLVVDPRGAYATAERFPEAAIVHAGPQEALAAAGLDRWTSVVTVTHDPRFDLPALAAALRSPVGYIGALGSRRTHAGREERLRAQGFGDDDLARIHAPVGLDLGGRTPPEIALSIVAEIQAVRHGRDPRAARPRPAAIHAEPAA
jgi:xanthine dehydrogenase accessory factor